MEYALRVSLETEMSPREFVLILVLMEYALRDKEEICNNKIKMCLNPCFNGICSASANKCAFNFTGVSLNPCFNGICSASLGEFLDRTMSES